MMEEPLFHPETEYSTMEEYTAATKNRWSRTEEGQLCCSVNQVKDIIHFLWVLISILVCVIDWIKQLCAQ